MKKGADRLLVSLMRYILCLVLFLPLFSVAAPAKANKPPVAEKQPAEFKYQDKIQLQKAWQIVSSAENVPVAVIDFDFQIDHPAIKKVLDVKSGRDYSNSNWSLIMSPDLPHGSLVAGLVATQHKNSWIIPFNLDSIDRSYAKIIAAVYDATAAGARVINMSLSILNVDADGREAFRKMAQYTLEKDVLLIVSASNYNDDLADVPAYPAVLSSEFSHIVTVGASDPNDQPSRFSNYSSKYVSLYAPGENIRIISPTGDRFSHGTSEAAPITTGVAALMRQLRPDLTASEVKEILLSTTDKSAVLAAKSVSGGRLNAYKAVRAAQLKKLTKIAKNKLAQGRGVIALDSSGALPFVIIKE